MSQRAEVIEGVEVIKVIELLLDSLDSLDHLWFTTPTPPPFARASAAIPDAVAHRRAPRRA